jgi:hypothetical protein
MNRALIEAIIYLAAFLELSDDDIVDPDSAAKQLENLGDTLNQLSPEDRDAFADYLDQFASSQRTKGASKEFVDFVSSFTRYMGWKD